MGAEVVLVVGTALVLEVGAGTCNRLSRGCSCVGSVSSCSRGCSAFESSVCKVLARSAGE